MRPAAAALRRGVRGERPRAGAAPRRPRVPPRLVRALVLALGCAALLAAGYQFWFRDSSLVAVERVTVEGLTTEQAPRVRKALVAAAGDMTTLHVRPESLERAVAAYPSVESVDVVADFPHSLRVTVVEQSPAAVLAVRGEGDTPVAADGTLLDGLSPSRALPELSVSAAPAGERLRDPAALPALRIAEAAPEALAGRVRLAAEGGDRALVAALRDGPEIVFGDASRAEAKWAAASAALADPSAAGAEYVDVRLPERPAVGGGSSASGDSNGEEGSTQG